MITKLTFRNSRRLIKEYNLFIITIILSVAILYSFNVFSFSSFFVKLSDYLLESGDNGSIYISFFYSCIMILSISWMINYMQNFMLKKRSEEFGTYLLLGIEKRQLSKMYIMENIIIGIIAFIPGIFAGWIFTIFINQLINYLYKGELVIINSFSPLSIFLTLIYFTGIHLILLFFYNYRIYNLKIITLLDYKKHNEICGIKNPEIGLPIFFVSIFLGMGSIVLFIFQPLSNDYSNMLFGCLLIFICYFGIYFGICPILYTLYKKSNKWKFKSGNIFLFRLLTAKINKTTILFGFISSLFTLSLLFISTGFSYSNSLNILIDETTYDLSIIHFGSKESLEQYHYYLEHSNLVENSYSYNLYSNRKNNFMNIRNNVLEKYFMQRSLDVNPMEYLYDQNIYDMFISYSDYNKLRNLLGYPTIALPNDQYLIHCLPYLEKDFYNYAISHTLNFSDCKLSFHNIFTENFSQYDGYGNGQEFIIVIPDNLINELNIVYSIYAASLSQPHSISIFSEILINFPSLKIMDLNFVEGSTGPNEYMTKLNYGYTYDYISGKYVILSTKAEIMLIISLFYLGVLLCLIATIILSVQLLSDNIENRYRYSLLNMFGMNTLEMKKLLKRQIIITFAFPAIPTFLLCINLIYIVINTVIEEYFLVPIVLNIKVIVYSIFVYTIIIFLLIYILYSIIVFKISKKDILNF